MSADASIADAITDMFPEAPREVSPLEKDQRFTLRETDAWCRRKAGVAMWDLDVAACEESHLAGVFYTVETDGLSQPWFGRVWCNPPFSAIEPWVKKAWEEMQQRHPGPEVIAMLIPATRTEQPWWQEYVERDRDGRCDAWPRLTTHFLPGRTSFGCPGNRDGVGVGSPPFTCVLLVWRT